jgi:8-oxo-dGTP pyrophosphatase MutT (NUDIX family)
VTDILDLDGPNPWRTQASRVIFANQRLRLLEDDVIQPDGDSGTYVYVQVETPIVAVVPVDAEGYVYLVRQWRYPWRRNSWEIPAGSSEPDEAPIDGARRELAEEVGLCAAYLEPLPGGHASATIDSHFHLFLGRGLGLAPAGRHQLDPGEHDLIVRRLPMVDAIEAALDGRIAHFTSVVGLLRAARRLGL